MQCWAKELGDCKGKISKEHLVSGGIFGDQMVFAKGLSWCLEDHKEIGISSIASKILCEKHNNDLSAVDQGAIDAYDAITKIVEIGLKRKDLPKNKANRLTILVYEINGRILERWFLKTTINIIQSEKQVNKWYSNCLAHKSAPLHLVKGAFGMEDLNKPMGLYCLVRQGLVWHSADRITCYFLEENEKVACVLYEFRGFLFLLWLIEKELPSIIQFPRQNGVFYREDFKYHVEEMTFNLKINNKKSQILKISWH